MSRFRANEKLRGNVERCRALVQTLNLLTTQMMAPRLKGLLPTLIGALNFVARADGSMCSCPDAVLLLKDLSCSMNEGIHLLSVARPKLVSSVRVFCSKLSLLTADLPHLRAPLSRYTIRISLSIRFVSLN